ncbi:transcriptional regulator with XRE-family HTH domain [Desulfitispora alkaliphila]|uniref:helix-turn-helix domain-containing protein n=1 Tax=Desulfitispora alkaliphila TaxID=622674 RepID=UPI003D242D66
MSVGEKIKRLRTEKKISLDDLAVKLDVPVGCLKDVELGKRHLNQELLRKFATLAGENEDYFEIKEKEITTDNEAVNQLAHLSSSVGNKIRKLREERGLTLVELGKKSGISYTHISEIERGNTCPSLKTINKLANNLGYPVTYFFTDKSPVAEVASTLEISSATIDSEYPVLEKLKQRSEYDLKLALQLLNTIKSFRESGKEIPEDPINAQINKVLEEMSKEDRQATLDYALFLKSKHITNG